MYLSINSSIVSHSAVNVDSDSNGVRCCRNTLEETIMNNNHLHHFQNCSNVHYEMRDRVGINVRYDEYGGLALVL